MPQVLQFPKRQTLATLTEPSRADDERLIRTIRKFEEVSGVPVLFPDLGECEVVDLTPAQVLPVSPYLNRPLRSEAEVRALRNEPRVPKVKGLADLIAEQTGLDKTFARLFGGGQ
jgi:hypothetical protein